MVIYLNADFGQSFRMSLASHNCRRCSSSSLTIYGKVAEEVSAVRITAAGPWDGSTAIRADGPK